MFLLVSTLLFYVGPNYFYNKRRNNYRRKMSLPKISFEIRYSPPKSVETRIIVVGGPAELGGVNLSKRKFFQNFEKQASNRFKVWVLNKMHEQQSDSSDDEDDTDDDPSECNTEEEPTDALTQNERFRNQVLDFLGECFYVLEQDPHDQGVENLWAALNPLEFSTTGPGERFSYAYIVWNCDDNRLWEYEKFHEARELTIPHPQVSNPTNNWVARARAFGSRQSDLRAARNFRIDEFYRSSSNEDLGPTTSAIASEKKSIDAFYNDSEGDDDDF